METTLPERKRRRNEGTSGKKKKGNSSRTILDLPGCVLGDIFTKLQIAAILNCKRVCKAWYFVLLDRDFAKAYHTKHPFPIIAVSCGNSVFCFLELNADNSYAIKRSSQQIFRNPPEFCDGKVTLLGSFNGLLLFLQRHHPDFESRTTLYISNPLLGEYALLPQPIVVPKVAGEAYGFGFSPKTGHYKVLRIIKRKWLPGKGQTHVCTIGVDENWRILGDNAPFPQPNRFEEGSIFDRSRFCEVNGAVHWIVEDLTRPDFIYSFDIGEEKVCLIPTPPGLSGRNRGTRLGVLSGCLCVFHPSGHRDLDIWCMKEYGVIESWSKKVALGCFDSFITDGHYPILIWRNGEILMSHVGAHMISYNPTTKLSAEITAKLDSCLSITEVPYVPSFLPLEEALKAQHYREGISRELGLSMKYERKRRITLLGRPENSGPLIQRLPTYILGDIFSRIPDTTILRCKYVCKTWYNFISDPFFNETYIRSQNDINLVLSNRASVCWFELKGDNKGGVQPNAQKILQRSIRLAGTTQSLLGSCNGLICLSSFSHSGSQCHIYICNPQLQEYAELPLPDDSIQVREEGYGFGFSSTTGHYKVLRIVSYKQSPGRPIAEILTVGNDKRWRRVYYHAPFAVPRKYSKLINKSNICEVTLNGAFHWIPEECKKLDLCRRKVDFICSFDIGTEEFRPIPKPSGMEKRNSWVALGVLRDCLCIFRSSLPPNLDIWWMKEYGVSSSWTKESILGSYIPVGPTNRQVVVPITICRNGEILMSVGCGLLISYCPVKKRSIKIGIDIDIDHDQLFTALTYNPSFVSVNAAARGGPFGHAQDGMTRASSSAS